MAEATIPVDLRNPGQVFACLGLMEAAEALCPEPQRLRREPVTGGYAWEEGATAATFTLSAPGEDDPVRSVIAFLSTAEAVALNAPLPSGGGVGHRTERWGVPTEVFCADDHQAFPFNPPDKPGPLPLLLRDPSAHERAVLVAHWGCNPAVDGRDNVRFWGSAGYPGVALARDALALLADLDGRSLVEAATDPFAVAAPQSSSFNLDLRRGYTPLRAGFSVNAHGSITIVGFPLVELLAAIGLENARPERLDWRNKLSYRYNVSNARLPLLLARAVLGCADLGFPQRRFLMQLDYVGQEGQGRCIIDSRED